MLDLGHRIRIFLFIHLAYGRLLVRDLLNFGAQIGKKTNQPNLPKVLDIDFVLK